MDKGQFGNGKGGKPKSMGKKGSFGNGKGGKPPAMKRGKFGNGKVKSLKMPSFAPGTDSPGYH